MYITVNYVVVVVVVLFFFLQRQELLFVRFKKIISTPGVEE